MNDDIVNYERLYSESVKKIELSLLDNNISYALDRKVEALAFLLALETGLRASDLLMLKFKDFKFDKDIEANIFTTVITKSKSTHIGVVSNELFRMIALFSKSLVIGHGLDIYDRSEYIFYNYNTYGLYTRQWLHKRVKIMAKNLEFEDFGIRDIRRASAHKVLENTGSISLTQYHLGHIDKKTTKKFIGVTKMSELQRLAKVF